VAWRLMRVCKAARVGAKEWLSRLGLVVCGGFNGPPPPARVRDVWRLDLATLRWEPMPALVGARFDHAYCAVRGALVVLGGVASDCRRTSSVEMLSGEQGAFVNLPSLSCGRICLASAIAVDESDSAAGQVILLGGAIEGIAAEVVRLVDLATGTCTRQPDKLHARYNSAAARLKDGRVVCAGGGQHPISAEVYGPRVQGALDAPWVWTELPAMSVDRHGCRACVLSDGRFAVLGGECNGSPSSSCEALVAGVDAHWGPLAPMHDSRDALFACAPVAGCVIVAGGAGHKSAEVYNKVLDRWFWLPRDLPHDGNSPAWMGSALL
jgi:hypothetical protein